MPSWDFGQRAHWGEAALNPPAGGPIDEVFLLPRLLLHLPDQPTMHEPASEPLARNNRVLVIDDNPSIHADVRKILCPQISEAAASVNALEAELLGTTSSTPARPVAHFAVESAHQGREGLELVKRALAAGLPYAMAFVDVRMPPGWDGVETTLELWKVAPDLQIVICTAYSDYSWDDMLTKLGSSDRLVILKKPFDTIEVLQLANSLTEKWNLLAQTHAHAELLEQRVRERTAALEASNVALQDEITRRIAMELDLKRAKDAAESADRAKSAFLANMSHEIRTPMNGVIGMANLLLSSPLTAEQRDLADTLCQSSEALLTIINDILDFSKIEAGRLVLESVDFDLQEHLELALDLHADAAARKSLELVMHLEDNVPSAVRGDPVRLRQIILNLLGNAIKFTPQGEVVLNVSLDRKRGEHSVLRFAVTDTGIGISPAVQKTLFQPFVQADSSTTRRFGGTGLGLAICKRLAELMHGEIGVTSAGLKGSTFWFTAELEPPLDSGPKLTLAPSQLERHHALIVDDNATNRKLLTHLCTRWRLRHRAAADAHAAMAELRAAAQAGRPFDLLILDHHMPDIDGLGLTAMLDLEKSLPRAIRVLLTSRGERLPQAQMDAHGLAACELKPIHPERLRSTLARIMATHSPAFGSRLPASASENTLRQTSLLPAVVAQPHFRILVAEDNPVNQKVTLLQLRNLGYSADVVNNGREAVDAVQRKAYALVLMDAQMPEMDGMAATRRIRAAQAAGEAGFPADLRIIAMTANAMCGDREMCISAGMDDYLPKPVKPEALREVLARYLTAEPAVEIGPGCALAR
jgi:signal transduction histidine kinase/response regulator of citrate/malate metabolism